MNTTNDWSREAHRARFVQALAPDYTPAIITKQAVRHARANTRANLPQLLARQLDHELVRERSANAALAPMAKLGLIRILRTIREVLT